MHTERSRAIADLETLVRKIPWPRGFRRSWSSLNEMGWRPGVDQSYSLSSALFMCRDVSGGLHGATVDSAPTQYDVPP
jgi:hypothetical protein